MIDLALWPDPVLLGRYLAILATDIEEAHKRTKIGTDLILAKAWKPHRLERCRQQLREGMQPPDVSLMGYRIGRQTLYVVSDGMHRTIAAREAGLSVMALISGYGNVYVDRYLVRDGWLWVRDGKDQPPRRGIRRLEPGDENAFARIGIEVAGRS